ncbi:MAG: hypothetical protein ABIQ39_01515 [Ilumatobacteraceae bacterium]
MSDDDPGWKIRWSLLPAGLMPHLYFMRRSVSGTHELITIRSLFVGYCLALTAVGGVRAVLGDFDKPQHTQLAVVTSVVIGLALVVFQHLLPLRLNCSSAAALRATYRSRFFLRAAIVNIAAIIAFVVSLQLGAWWTYFVGFGCALVGLADLAPTKHRVVAEQDRLVREGCSLSLIAALRAG